MNLSDLKANQRVMRQHDRHYIDTQWKPKEEEFVWYCTKSYPNLGSTSSQRGENYHPVIREITNGQLSFERSAKNLSQKVLSILEDLATDEDDSLRHYVRTA